MRVQAAILTVVALCGAPLGAIAEASVPIGQGGRFSGGFAAGDADSYRFSLAATRRVRLETTGNPAGCSGDTTLSLYRGDGARIAFDDDGGAGLCSRIVRDLPAGDYTVSVAGYAGRAVGSYLLGHRAIEGSRTPLMGPFDGLSAVSNEPALAPREFHTLEIRTQLTRRLTVRTSDGRGGCPGDTLVTVYSVAPNGSLGLVDRDDDGGVGLCSRVDVDLPPGTYWMQVGGYAGRSVPAYQLGYEVSSETPVSGEVCEHGARDCNAYVTDIVGDVRRLSSFGELLGFHMPGDSGHYPGHWYEQHNQGLQRLASRGDVPYFALSSNRDGRAHVAFVRMGSRGGAGEENMRSNKLNGAYSWSTPPLLSDTVVAELTLPGLEHPGGIQRLGHYLFVPLESSDGCDGGGRMDLIDVTNPASPRAGPSIPLPPCAAAVGVAKLAGQRYLMAVARKDTRAIDFYIRSGSSPWSGGGWALKAGWNGGYNMDWQKYQAINLVTDAAGDLFLLGTVKTGRYSWSSGTDLVDLYRISLREGAGTVVLSPMARRAVFCSTPETGEHHGLQCNFKAGVGAFVDADHRLTIYASEHAPSDRDDPLRLKQFRSTPAIGSRDCPTMAEAWVELHQHAGYEGYAVRFDWLDRDARSLTRLSRVDDFNDRASSARWCLPAGARFTLSQHAGPSGGDYVLHGNGAVRGIGSFGGLYFDNGDRLNDAVSAVAW